jgi:LCP family protein required for cell wall assembly
MRVSAWLPGFLRRFVIAFVVASLLSVGVLAVVDGYATHEFRKRTTVHLADGVLAPYAPAKPANFLLVGHDDTGNADTMMVIHLDPAEKAPLLVSFPRDLMVEIPGHSGQRQLNSAYGLGGPALLVRTLEKNFHFPIQRFLQVDFATFPQLVDAIGHVKVWFPTPVHDPYIGLDVESPGCVALNGSMSLAYVRSRHYYVPDTITDPAPWSWNYPAQTGGEGWTASGSDIDRIPRQQYFLRTIAQTAVSRTNDDPLRIIDLVDALMTHLTTDENLTLGELKALVRTFRRVQPADVEMTTLPWTPDPDDPNRVVVKYPDAVGLLGQLANFKPPQPFLPVIVNPDTVRVRVVDGSGDPGIAAGVLDDLVAAGFRSAGPVETADRSDYARTEVRWDSAKANEGVTVVYATGAKKFGEATVPADTLGGDVLVIVGRDWTTLRHHLTDLPGTQTTQPGDPGTSTTQLPTTSTTISHFQSVDPNTGALLIGCPSKQG